MSKVLVIGGGAAGMMAAIAAAENGASVEIIEKNEKTGKKIFITGKGRCNITNSCDRDSFFKAVKRNGRFLFSAIDRFDNEQVISFFEKAGLPVKIERGQRVFPVSDKSSDVIKTLNGEIARLGIRVRLNTEVKNVAKEGEKFRLICSSGHNTTDIYGDSVIVATGGVSYPSTGSTGDGYRFGKNFGHTVSEPVPCLTGLEAYDDFPAHVQGLSLKNVILYLEDEKGKKLCSEPGEMLFTHYGVSGPLVLSASCVYAECISKGKPFPKCFIDLKPGMSTEELADRIFRDFEKEKNRDFSNSLFSLLPSNLVPEIVSLSGTDPSKKVNSVTKEERKALAFLLKHLEIHVKGVRGFDEAIITKGGINVKEIDPSTMESKIVQGLYFAGEVIDLDAETGGFNLQIAWSTGYAAGSAAAGRKDI